MLLRNRYEPLRIAGRGGQGEVHQALDHLHGRLVALKMRRVPAGADRDAILREARVLLHVTPHAHLPLVRDDFFARRRYYLVMDWIEGTSLRDVLERRGRPGLPLDTVLACMEDVAAALDHLHAHTPPVVHGDVKPANIVLTPDRGAVLVDFGLSHGGEDRRIGGTPGYIAPEVLDGAGATPPADVYALAVTAFHLLSGSRPAPGARLDDAGLRGADARRVRDTLAAGLHMEPAGRPATAGTLVDAMRGRTRRAPARLPGPTPTLMFTDIEASTRLLHTLGNAFLEILQDHNRLIRDAIAAHRGHEVKTEGDAFFVAFADPRDAVAASLAAQRALSAFDWPDGAVVRVRMGLHTGDAHVVSNDYVGLAVHEAARVCAAAHGGQILLTATTAHLAGTDFPAGASLVDMGEHLLRDFPEPRRLFALRHPDLRADAPPPRSAASPAKPLPVPPTALVGRVHELERAIELLRSGTRLVTITGPGGMGKTRLALEVAAQLGEGAGVTACFAPLADVGDPVAVPNTVAEAVGARADGNLLDAIADRIGASPTLVVLDNFEHLMDAAPTVADLLARCPALSCLVTSREALRVGGERELVLDPLDMPAAVRLLEERAHVLRVNETNVASVEALCRLLDGMPLAIELAAARLRLLTPAELLERLEDGLGALGGGGRAAPERHRTLTAAIDWSYRQADDAEASFLNRLGVFVGGATLTAAEAVCARDALAALDALVDRSLVRRETGPAGEPRFTMLEPIRRFALDHLAPEDEVATRKRHAAWFTSWAERAEPELTGPEQAHWLALVDADHANLRAALQTASADAGLAIRLSAALVRYWAVRGHWTEGRHHLEAALRLEGGPAPARVRAELGAGFLAAATGDLETGVAHLQSSLALARDLGDDAGAARALNQLGEIARRRGDDADAATRYGEALALARRAGDDRTAGQILINRAALHVERREVDAARPLYAEALAIMHGVGDRRGEATILEMQGMVGHAAGDAVTARDLLVRSVEVYRTVGDRQGLAQALQNLGIVEHAAADVHAAAALWEESLAIHRDLGNMRGVAGLLCNLGFLAEPHDADRARSYYAQALGIARGLPGERRTLLGLLVPLGHAAARRGDLDEADALLAEAASIAEALGDPTSLADALEARASLAEGRSA